MKAVEVEPVHRLGGGNQRNGCIRDRQVFRHGQFVAHPWVRLRPLELRTTAVHGHDCVEVLGQRNRRLAVASGAVDGQRMIGRAGGDPRDQLGRIAGAVAAVVPRLPREMVLERRRRHAPQWCA